MWKVLSQKVMIQKEAIPLSSRYIGSIASSQSEAAVYKNSQTHNEPRAGAQAVASPSIALKAS